ncbi:hypothetical protein RvY_17992 [Ramazzottius varieornatus]|uniref:Peptidase M13 N-terminal domain-containing protein n=1 Tax=Ramazzottius varieornatus TaxID=947166 RepID=A0A1D1W4T7_RAMVA|nr:hypothetical protein RvY_17992 [Ramazzottius varieornatus]
MGSDHRKFWETRWFLSILLAVMIFLCFLTITFGALWASAGAPNLIQDVLRTPATPEQNSSGQPSSAICTTPACVAAAYRLNRAMNKKVGPCDDFYDYACGSFSQTEAIPEGKTSWDAFEILQRQVYGDLRAILTAPDIDGNLHSTPTDNITQNMQRYFHSCVDTSKIFQHMRRLEPLAELLDKEFQISLADWPLTEGKSAVADPQRLKQAIMAARKYGNSLGILNNYLGAGMSHAEHNAIVFNTGTFTLDSFILLDDNRPDIHNAYVDYMVDVAFWIQRLLGNEQSAALIENYRPVFQDILQFERALANVSRDAEYADKVLEISLVDFAKVFFSPFGGSKPTALHMQAEEWVQYFKTAWASSAQNITVTTNIVVNDPGYYVNLNLLLSGLKSSDTFLWNYVVWKVIEPLVRHLGDQGEATYQRFRKSVYVEAVNGNPSRSGMCIDTLIEHFPNAIEHLYIKNFSHRQVKRSVEIMAEYVMVAFREMVKESDWLSASDRIWFLGKADKMTKTIGYDEYLTSDSAQALNSEHEAFQPDRSNIYFNNYMKGRAFQTRVEGEMFGKRDGSSGRMSIPKAVSAFYAPRRNSVTIPAGFLQEPMFGADYPWYWNFAVTGSAIGHEITHAFDAEDVLLDGDGAPWDKSGMSNETLKLFEQRAGTIVNQYSNYSLAGEDYLSENIADNGGLKASYMAYQKFRDDAFMGKEETILPGFEHFTTDQMFFLSYAHLWCEATRPITSDESHAAYSHSPARFRVIGPLHNSAKFSEAYQCGPQTYMNATKKAAVW